MRAHFLVAALTGLVLLQSPAHALFADDDARKAILELRQQLKTMQENQTQMYDRIQNLTKEVQTLRGEMDDLNYGKQQDQASAVQDKAKPDTTPKLSKAAQAAQDKEVLARQNLDEGLALFNKQQYSKAAQSFSKFTQNYSTTKLYPEGLYWLGSSYFGAGNYGKAIEVENRLINSYPKHAKVPEALLILGLAQESSGKQTEANATFDKLKKQYPKSEAAKNAP